MSLAWTVHTVMRRRWHDGTEFTIRDHDRGCHLTVTNPAGLKAHSWHPDTAAAMAHADELIASLTDPDIDDYRVPDSPNQMELS